MLSQTTPKTMNAVKLTFPTFFIRTFSTPGKSTPKKNPKKFIDWKRVKVLAGNGGDGCTSFRRERYIRKGGPNGGDGGDGGNVVFVASSNLTSMRPLRYKYRAEDGGSGEGMDRRGMTGKDTVIKVPLGTVVKEDGCVIADLAIEGAEFIIAEGGEGGKGNVWFTTSEDRASKESTEGTLGQERTVEVELQTIADVGMVGLPNAGKSTLLRCISRARPRVAAYPFTTLNPHIGVIGTPEGTKLSVADIPGIIPRAHENIGLGHSFLRHIERCHSLLYVLDPSSNTLPDSLVPDCITRNGVPDLYQQLLLLQNELKEYNEKLLDKYQIVVVNKMDIDGIESAVRELNDKINMLVIPISGLYRLNIQNLITILLNTCK